MISFKGAHFPQDVVLMAIRWYLAYALSYRDEGHLPPSLLSPYRIQSGDQLSARLAVQQSRHREAISPLKGSQCRLGLGRKEAVDRAWVIPKRL